MEAIFDWISPAGVGEMVVFGGRGPTPWRGPHHQPQLKPQTQAQHRHQWSWPGQTTSASGDCTNQLLSTLWIYSIFSGYHRPCRQSSMSRPSQLWQFGWVPFSCTAVMFTRLKCTLAMKLSCVKILCAECFYILAINASFFMKISDPQFGPWVRLFVCVCVGLNMCVCVNASQLHRGHSPG